MYAVIGDLSKLYMLMYSFNHYTSLPTDEDVEVT